MVQGATIAAATARTPLQLADDARRICCWSMTTAVSAIFLSRFLSGEGYRVTTAASASDARAKLLGLHFDLLILDVMMLRRNRLRSGARFIRTSSSVPIIMLDGAP